MSILDVKRTKEDFLKKKGKSSEYTLRSYGLIFKSFEKFTNKKYELVTPWPIGFRVCIVIKLNKITSV